NVVVPEIKSCLAYSLTSAFCVPNRQAALLPRFCDTLFPLSVRLRCLIHLIPALFSFGDRLNCLHSSLLARATAHSRNLTSFVSVCLRTCLFFDSNICSISIPAISLSEKVPP